MPTYEYACPACGATAERFRRVSQRNRVVECACGKRMRLTISRPHVAPDGVYSYAPNMGSAEAFERKMAAIKRTKETGVQQVIEKHGH